MNNLTETKYVITVKQLAKIVGYCVNETIAGDDVTKDWTNNIERAIGIADSKIISVDKIILQKISSAIRIDRDEIIKKMDCLGYGRYHSQRRHC